jgi:protein TonB
MKNTRYFKFLLLLFMGIFTMNSISYAQAIKRPKSDSDSEIIKEDEIVSTADKMPRFKGGDKKLQAYLNKNLNYPKLAKENRVEGTIYISFVVTKKGKITNITQLNKKNGWGLDEEAYRVVKYMPKWKPAKQNGKRVNCKLTLPIKFRLN